MEQIAIIYVIIRERVFGKLKLPSFGSIQDKISEFITTGTITRKDNPSKGTQDNKSENKTWIYKLKFSHNDSNELWAIKEIASEELQSSKEFKQRKNAYDKARSEYKETTGFEMPKSKESRKSLSKDRILDYFKAILPYSFRCLSFQIVFEGAATVPTKKTGVSTCKVSTKTVYFMNLQEVQKALDMFKPVQQVKDIKTIRNVQTAFFNTYAKDEYKNSNLNLSLDDAIAQLDTVAEKEMKNLKSSISEKVDTVDNNTVQ